MVGIDSIIEVQLTADRLCRLNPNQPLNIVTKFPDRPPKPKVIHETKKADVRVISPTGSADSSFVLPEEYIKFDGKEIDSSGDQIEYDVDDEDSEWLSMVNERREKEKMAKITDEEFERVIDMLEKASIFKSDDRFSSLDEDELCCICNDGETTNTNQIIFCDMCNIPVHQECYGVPYIPAGQWLCRRCQLSPSQPVQCVLCPYTNGAFKQTSDGRWAHVVCALWLPEVHFANVVFLEPIEGIKNTLEKRCKLKCTVCKFKNGACLQCNKKSCFKAFHVTCGIYSDLIMKVEHRGENEEDSTVHRFGYCHRHSAYMTLNKNETQAAMKRSIVAKCEKAKRILQNSKNRTNQIALPVIPDDKLQEIKSAFKMERIEDVHHYWYLKRKARCGVPLLRRLQVYHSKKISGQKADKSLDSIASSPQGDQLVRTGKLRNDLEKLRLLVELVKKREKFKLEIIQNYRNLVESVMKPQGLILEETLEKLIAKDHQEVFTLPVSDSDVPGYSKIIKNPMDFTKMKSKLVKGEYKKVNDIRTDFNLIMDNCETFNRNTPYFLRYGNTMKLLGNKLLKAAEGEEQYSGAHELLKEIPKLLESLKEEPQNNSNNQPSETTMSRTNATKSFLGYDTASKELQRNKRKYSKIINKTVQSNNTKINDFFKPLNALNSSETQSPDPKKPRPENPFKHRAVRTEYVTETSSASDTGGATSTDEDGPLRSRLRKRSLKADKSPLVSEQFRHNDIVWAPYKNKDKLPARIINRTFATFEEDKSLQEKVRSYKTPLAHNATLVLFFDSALTLDQIPLDQIQLCDVLKKNSSDNSQVSAALKKAKDYWNKAIE